MRTFLIVVLATLVALGGITAPQRAKAQTPVTDVANLAQNIMQAIRSYQQLIQMYKDYQLMVDQYRDLKESLSSMNLRDLLLQYADGVDPRLGWSALAYAQYLDVDSPEWKDKIESLLRLHYGIPDEYDLNSAISAAQLGQGSDVIYQQVAKLQRESAPLLDVWHFEAAQRKASEDRQDMIEKLSQRMQSLGDKGEVRNLQAIGGTLSLVAKQQEAQLDALQMIASGQQHTQQLQLAARYETLMIEMKRLENLRSAPARPRLCGDCMKRW